MTFSTQKNIAFGYRKTRYRYLAVLYLFSFFGDIFLRLHLRDLCYTGHNERLKNRDYNISLIYRLSVMLSLCYDPNMVIAAVPKS